MRTVDRKQFLSKAKYKAENSMKLVFKPKQKIGKIASELTGLTTDNLNKQESFNSKAADLIKIFLLRLIDQKCNNFLNWDSHNMAAASSVPVETLVFMHSKASDSSKDGANSRITEICMQAVSRKHFLSKAMNKYENTIKLVVMPKDEKEQTVSNVTAEKEEKSKQESLDAADAELLKFTDHLPDWKGCLKEEPTLSPLVIWSFFSVCSSLLSFPLFTSPFLERCRHCFFFLFSAYPLSGENAVNLLLPSFLWHCPGFDGRAHPVI
ncbi:unnamed protein product [Acanthosepion pharaonis]|uniref:Uncharacterized protein n=1 Tax=Acanthosepion pharaonis TaxID=158019 RepID=A0A812E805_ACAPH|nr:unnamed protein product [Sepia pharaonis]